jgi:hypothetical protein
LERRQDGSLAWVFLGNLPPFLALLPPFPTLLPLLPALFENRQERGQKKMAPCNQSIFPPFFYFRLNKKTKQNIKKTKEKNKDIFA